MSSIQSSQLSNGLRVVTDRIENVETAALGMWVKAGSRVEDTSNNGIAHFLEHMAFKGTTSQTPFEIAQRIESVGGFMNAATSRETTAYYVRLLKEDVQLGIEILGDILLNSTFNEAELERERGVILQELGMILDTPDELIFDHFQQAAFNQQPVGKTILGPAQNIRSFQRLDLQNFMDEQYFAEQMVFAASGHVDHDKVAKLAEQYFGSLPRRRKVKTPSKDIYTGGEIITQKDLEQLHIILGFPGISITDPRYYALSVLVSILGGGMSSRLFRQIREKLGLVYTVFAFKACYADTGTVGIYAGTSAEEARKLIPALTDEIKSICDCISQDELSRAKAQLKSGLMMGLESTTSRCEHLANQMLFFGRPKLSQEIIAHIDAVTVSGLLELAQQIFTPHVTLSALGPAQHLPPASSIAQNLS